VVKTFRFKEWLKDGYTDRSRAVTTNGDADTSRGLKQTEKQTRE
jgi:hypothetical protein